MGHHFSEHKWMDGCGEPEGVGEGEEGGVCGVDLRNERGGRCGGDSMLVGSTFSIAFLALQT